MPDWMTAATRMVREGKSILSSHDLMDAAEAAARQAGVEKPSLSTIRRWMNKIITEEKIISKVHRDLYRSEVPGVQIQPAMVAHHVRPTAIVSMQSVLGEKGIINNPARIVMAVINASGPDATRPRKPKNSIAEIHLSAMKEEVYLAGEVADRIDASASYPKATPERALCDWLYFAGSGAHEAKQYPPASLDDADLDWERIHRLVDAMAIHKAFDIWMAKYQKAQQDEDFVYQTSSRLGL